MMKYTVALNSEGKVVYYDGKGREKEIQITNDAARKIFELYGKRNSVSTENTRVRENQKPSAAVTANNKKEDDSMKNQKQSRYGVQIIPEDLLGYPGVMKGDKGLYYLMCTCCGSTITPSQARFGIKEYGQAMCIDCQRKYKREHKVYRCPETRFGLEIKYQKPCQNEGCKRMVSGMQTSLSLDVTNGKYRLCPKCLANYAKTKKVETKAEQKVQTVDECERQLANVLGEGPEI